MSPPLGLPSGLGRVVDVSGWSRQEVEEIGARDKVWLRQADASLGASWLFKRGRNSGLPELGADLWAELLAAVAARLMQVPAPEVRLADLRGVRGAISRRIDLPMAHGNELLATDISGYERNARGPVAGYDLGSIEAVLLGFTGSEEGLSAFESFAGYLVFDALIANTDRHHENWAVISAIRALAPSYDHGASLGFNVPPSRRADVANTAARARSRHFAGKPTLVELAAQALDRVKPEVRALWLGRAQGF